MKDAISQDTDPLFSHFGNGKRPVNRFKMSGETENLLGSCHKCYIILATILSILVVSVKGDECSLTPVIHILSYPGCLSKPIPSFACQGRCSSYVQVSGSKVWQTERSCMCCQESGEREASVTLVCPRARPGEPRVRKVTTRAPVDCMCRPCTDVEEGSVLAQEIANFVDDSPLGNVPFLK